MGRGDSDLTRLVVVKVADGRELRQLVDLGPSHYIGGYSISPDDSRVWLLTIAHIPPTQHGFAPGQSCGDIDSVSLSGGQLAPLRTKALGPTGTYIPYVPAQSPDGRFVAWGRELCHHEGEGGVDLDLVVTDVTTGAEHVLQHTPASDLVWSGDGRTLVSTGAGEFGEGVAWYHVAEDGTPTLAKHVDSPRCSNSSFRFETIPVGWSIETGLPIVRALCGGETGDAAIRDQRVEEIDQSGAVGAILVTFPSDQRVGTVSVRNGALLVEYRAPLQSEISGLEEVVGGRIMPLLRVAGRAMEQW